MMTLEETMTTTNDKQKEKIKTPFAKVIVEERGANSYFSILYFDPADKDFHIGYSSYYLDYVFNWLNEEFEIVEDENFALSALRPVSREQVEKVWEKCQHSRVCGTCKVCVSGRYQQANFCAACGAPMTDEAVDMMLARWKEAISDA